MNPRLKGLKRKTRRQSSSTYFQGRAFAINTITLRRRCYFVSFH